MALIISQGSGATIATDVVAGEHYSYSKITDGTVGGTDVWKVNSAGAGLVALNGNSTVVVGAALPSGTNAIGKLSANSGVDIGDVDVTSLPATPAGANYIGLVTVANTVPTTFSGNVTLDDGSLTGLVAGGAYIGLATVTVGAALPAGTNAIGKLSANSGVDIGDVDVTSISAGTNFIGQATVRVASGAAYIGLVTAVPSNTVRSISGNVTLSDSKGFIGLATVTGSALDIRSLNSTATLYAVVNTSAPGVSNSIVTVANTPLAVTVGNAMVTVTLGTKLDSTNDSVDIKSGATVTVNSAATIYAVVNTAAAGVGNSIVTVANVPLPVNANVSLSSSIANIGFATVAGSLLDIRSLNSTATLYAVVNTSGGSSNVTLNPSPNYIGLVTVANNLTVSNLSSTATIYAVVNTSAPGVSNSIVTVANTPLSVSAGAGITVFQGNQPWNSLGTMTVGAALPAGTNAIGKLSANSGVDIGDVDVTSISAGTNFIGHATVRIAANPNTYIGLVTATVGNNLTVGSISAGANYIGLASVNVGGTLPALTAGSAYVGLASVNIGGTLPALTAGAAYIGLASVNIGGTLPALTAGTTFIGLTTSWSRNAGTTKTLIPKPISISASGSATIFVPSNTFKLTHLLLNSDATVRVNIKSGASYLVGNASIGITLLPGGGFIDNGSPDSPVYVGLANAAALVVDTSATANVGGKVIYFDE